MVHYAPTPIGRTVKVFDGRRWIWRLLPEKAPKQGEPQAGDLFVWTDERGELRISRSKK